MIGLSKETHPLVVLTRFSVQHSWARVHSRSAKQLVSFVTLRNWVVYGSFRSPYWSDPASVDVPNELRFMPVFEFGETPSKITIAAHTTLSVSLAQTFSTACAQTTHKLFVEVCEAGCADRGELRFWWKSKRWSADCSGELLFPVSAIFRCCSWSAV